MSLNNATARPKWGACSGHATGAHQGGHDAAPVAKRLQLAADGDMIAFATILELF
jgi:hypothetical protein